MKRFVYIVSLPLLSCGGFDESGANSAPIILRVDAPSQLSGNDTVRIFSFDPDADAVSLLVSAADQSGAPVSDLFTRVPDDDGQDGDRTSGDGIFTGLFNSLALQALPSSSITVQFRLRDARHAEGDPVSILIVSCAAGSPPIISDLIAPDTVNTSQATTFVITLSAHDADGLFDIVSVTRTTPSGLVLPLRDNGSNGDAIAGDGIFTETVSVNPPPPAGSYLFRFKATDCAGLQSNEIQKTIVIVN